ncbi:aldehyde dehydrogenase (NADP(+)) [Blastococcus sp. PRF04-17]|uniref:aldehyde dehydrogenase (NADP(+)) n=1 Tax=Blastococcus sp. PRF04-17 TaxID=2933797 RepID=UPI001FF5FA92|nr:aldehyde dehydrogenase (NADP(+)) [Blastococcus sp. PRF04-17]UOY03357.1 aldehyde dehydrogenase (NADP(+)) [Blastococcus sp. PRF04-17]
MTIFGASIIAGRQFRGGHGSVRAVDPATGEQLEPEFCFAGPEEIEQATAAATEAFDAYRATTPEERARFLERIADNLVEIKDEIVARSHRESGLPVGRLTGEHDRTTNQLRLFARELRLGAHLEVRIDEAQPQRQPAPAPDLRQRQIPLGPVLVFGASNFPLAFSTAGGDTASALAAGCPVIVKGHNSHAGTAELAGQAIARAVSDQGLPPGVFSLLFGPGTTIGQQLAAHPAVAAIAFTGSRAGGTALMRTAADRAVPIPVYAEMSSINPVVLLPGALATGSEELAAGLAGSLTLGSGQFCTNPGLVLLPRDAARFTEALAASLAESAGQTMLSAGICRAYSEGLQRLETSGAERVAAGRPGPGENAPAPALFRTTAAHLRATPDLQDEVFGAAGLLVTYDDQKDLEGTLEVLQGQLTISVHATEADHDTVRTVLPVLERKAGRLIVNGWPTGVEVNHAMVHGGPFPATSDSRTTSVGTLAIQRFQRPVSYQGFPPDLLPPPVHPDNAWTLPRRLNGTPAPGKP